MENANGIHYTKRLPGGFLAPCNHRLSDFNQGIIVSSERTEPNLSAITNRFPDIF